MESFNLDAYERSLAGKGEIRRLREDGFIPGVLYGQQNNIPIAVKREELLEIVNKHGYDVPVSVNYDGSSYEAVFKEIQKDPVTKEIRHIDIMSAGTLH